MLSDGIIASNAAALKKFIDFANENGIRVNIVKCTENEKYYYIVDMEARLGGIMMLGENGVSVPLASGHKVTVIAYEGVTIEIKHRNGTHDLLNFTGCAEVRRADVNHAEIKLLIGDGYCTSVLSDGRSMFATGNL